MIKTFRFDTDRQEFSANTYVVGEKGGRCVVIDLGSTQDRVIEFIKENFTSCSGILLTHGHYDHIRGIRKFLNTFSCTVFVHQDDQELLEDPKLNLTHFQPEEDDISLNLSNIYLCDDEDEIDFKNGYIFKVISTLEDIFIPVVNSPTANITFPSFIFSGKVNSFEPFEDDDTVSVAAAEASALEYSMQ